MILYYIRHGDPTYQPDALTPLGIEQAEALSLRLSQVPFDEIYCSTSNRAIMTARPTCEKLGLEPKLVDFANEGHAWKEFATEEKVGKEWLFSNSDMLDLLCSDEIRELGDRWYEHSMLKEYHFENGVHRIYRESDAFFKELGYDHLDFTGKYRVLASNNKTVALFAHQGFGLAFLSCVLDIPYPMFCTHFDIFHTGVTVINFKENDGIAIPQILTFSSDSHLYKEGLANPYGIK